MSALRKSNITKTQTTIRQIDFRTTIQKSHQRSIQELRFIIKNTINKQKLTIIEKAIIGSLNSDESHRQLKSLRKKFRNGNGPKITTFFKI